MQVGLPPGIPPGAQRNPLLGGPRRKSRRHLPRGILGGWEPSSLVGIMETPFPPPSPPEGIPESSPGAPRGPSMLSGEGDVGIGGIPLGTLWS